MQKDMEECATFDSAHHHQRIAVTTPPSTRRAAPLVVDESSLATYVTIAATPRHVQEVLLEIERKLRLEPPDV